jgi:hypothetical protein
MAVPNEIDRPAERELSQLATAAPDQRRWTYSKRLCLTTRTKMGEFLAVIKATKTVLPTNY